MKKLYLYLVRKDAVSWPLLIVSFVAGYYLATLLFYEFGHSLPASFRALFL